ncbi:unnamed protein product [Amoebophrya sp. A120]|nr:unnamed protein product [Amoebophrya sp. A120]|eukprot:GSA120T00011800001.1
MEIFESENNATAQGYRVHRSGKNIIYHGKISKEGAADFQKATLEAILELEKEKAKKNKPPPPPAKPGANGTNGSPPASPEVAAPATPVDPPSGLAAKAPSSSSGSKAKSSCAENVATRTASDGEDVFSQETLAAGSFTRPTGVSNAAGEPGPEPEPIVQKKEAAAQTSPSPGSKTAASSSSATVPSEKDAAVVADKKSADLRFHFSSDGGSLAAGFAMMDTIKEARSQGHLTECISKGFVGSAATFPAFACEKRFASEHCLFLLHPPSRAGVQGQTEDLKIHADNLDLWHGTALKAYNMLSTVKSAFPRIKSMFQDNRYSTAADMQQCGFLDDVWP